MGWLADAPPVLKGARWLSGGGSEAEQSPWCTVVLNGFCVREHTGGYALLIGSDTLATKLLTTEPTAVTLVEPRVCSVTQLKSPVTRQVKVDLADAEESAKAKKSERRCVHDQIETM